MNWTTDRPTSAGWYYVYYPGNSPHQPPSVEIVELTAHDYGNGVAQLTLWEGTNGETVINGPGESCPYTHWAKIDLPDPPLFV